MDPKVVDSLVQWIFHNRHKILNLQPKDLAQKYPKLYMDVSLNGGTPKSSILIGFSI